MLVKEKRSRYGNQQYLKNLRSTQEKKQILIELALNGSINLINNGDNKMTINFKTPEIKELQPRLLVMGVGGQVEMQLMR